MAHIYVTGHRNPDTDSVASAIGYAQLKARLDRANEYEPVRLGELNAQTRWVLDRSGAAPPELLPHIFLRVRDVMQTTFPAANEAEPIREVGLTMAREDRDLLPVVDDDGRLVGVMTERALARRYVRESRDPTSLADAAARVSAIVEVLEGELVTGDDLQVAGRVWVFAMDVRAKTRIEQGDVVVVGNRPDAMKLALERGATLLVLSNGVRPPEEIAELAEAKGASVVVSPLDSYVTSRMITLSAGCRALMDRKPLTARPDDLLSDVAEQVKEVDYRAAVAVEPGTHRPVGLVTRSDLVSPAPRQVILVDHAEQAQSVPGVEEAEIIEILDHHHIGSIETRIPVRATFDPVGSTATLVIERFRQAGMEPSPPTATLLLGAMLSDTVILNSPTTTERDRAAVDFLERVLELDAREFGREMFQAGSDVSATSAHDLVTRDAKEYHAGGQRTLAVAQIETVGPALRDRTPELLQELEAERRAGGHQLYALMVTDILAKGTKLLVAGDPAPVERAFGHAADGGVVDLPGVMSRKKQVVPPLLAAV